MRSRTLLVGVFLSLVCGPSAAQDFTQVVSFGDSLTDTGNVSSATFGIAPGGNYFNGRYSNGVLWVEELAVSLNLSPPTPSRGGGRNYSHAGVKTGSGNTTFVFFNFPNVGTQITSYLGSNTPAASQLFTVWGGANNFLDNLGQNPTTIVNNLVAHVTALNNAGARHIVVPNLPLLGLTPRYNGNAANRDAYNNLTASFNSQLAAAMTTLDASIAAKVYQFDVASAFNQILANPANYGLTNVTQPALVGSTVVPNPDQYLFYDDVHPTRIGHRLLGDAALDLVNTHNWTGGVGNWSDSARWDATGVPAAHWIAVMQNSTPNFTEASVTANTVVRQVRVSGSGGPAVVSVGPATLTATESVALNAGAALRLSDAARVVTPQLQIATGAELDGGGEVTGVVENEGILMPGSDTGPVGSLSIDGDFAQASTGILRMDLAPSTADQLNVTGAAAFAGGLEFFAGQGTPLPGSSYDLVTFASASGDVNVVNQTGLAGLRFAKNLSLTKLSVTLTAFPGDANLDDIADIADFATLAANFNQAGNWLAGNFNGDGEVNIGDFSTLAANFNQSLPPAALSRAVPEPAAAFCLLTVMLLRRRRFA